MLRGNFALCVCMFPWKGPLFVIQSDVSHLLTNEFQTWPCSTMRASAILILFSFNIPVVEDIPLVCCDAALLQQSSLAVKSGAGVQVDAKGTHCHKHAWRCKCLAMAWLRAWTDVL